jgi:hypothetical protein
VKPTRHASSRQFERQPTKTRERYEHTLNARPQHPSAALTRRHWVCQHSKHRPTGKTFDVEFGQTTKWVNDQLNLISAFWDVALLARQIGLDEQPGVWLGSRRSGPREPGPIIEASDTDCRDGGARAGRR